MFLLPIIILSCAEKVGDDSALPEIDFVPLVGDWVIDQSSWLEDGCDGFLVDPSRFIIHDASIDSFRLLLHWTSGTGSVPSYETDCALDDGAIKCQTITRYFHLGGDSYIDIGVSVSGTFSSTASAGVGMQYDLLCYGEYCDDYIDSWGGDSCLSSRTLHLYHSY